MPPRNPPDPPRLAVVVATYARAHLLPRLLGALDNQVGAPPFEVVIVDDASPDDTAKVLDELADRTALQVHVIRQPRNRGPAAARNVGWRATSAPLLAFTDDDCAPEPGWLQALAAGLETSDVAQGRTIPDPDELGRTGPFSRSLSVEAEDGFYQTCNIGYRRRVLDEHGGFDEQFRFPAGEDTDLAWRARAAGASTTFRADAVVRHTVRPSSFLTAVRDTWRWQSVALALRRNPGLRTLIYQRWVWRKAHLLLSVTATLTALALALTVTGNAVAVAAGWIAAAASAAPYAVLRLHDQPMPGVGLRRRVVLLPAAVVVDAAEIVACLVGSVRYRRFVL
ncbi:MAG TPA: glycosyltransferase [Mycobacteriales bacterium]|nr:glycosyltransferase [Mycobacteriales bacterium]